MLVDEAKIYVSAGRGGDGAVAFNKNKMELGPTGGSGGSGGDIYLQGVADIGALKKFRFKKEFEAENGKDGRSQFRDGADGETLFLSVPVGTVIKNKKTGDFFEIKKIGEKKLVAKGGRGGRGNFLFRSSRNTSPKEFEEGKGGEDFHFFLELKLIADAGFIGLPNVGKSSMLNELTGAKSKVANYSFTTLEPNLGVYYGLIIADIPGLIKGAALGKGLGFKFLRHIERTKVLFHFISADSENPLEDYYTVREELKAYNKKLLQKEEYVVFSKRDNVSSEKIKELKKITESLEKKTVAVSILDKKYLEPIEKLLQKILKEKIQR